MPTLEENLDAWDSAYEWTAEGDEWSHGWGGADAQWYGSLLPRLRHVLPAARILEIAPGHGRWTHYLADHCDDLIGIDISETCVDICRQRFADDGKLSFHVNDGRSLDAVEDESVDLVFSFDSLVHAEEDVIGAYLQEIARKLTPTGRAFLHHSNAGTLRTELAGWDELGADEIRALELSGQRQPSHWRAMSMTAERMRDLAIEAGLFCSGQEIVNWGGDLLIDCMSLLVPSTAAAEAGESETKVVTNPDFSAEMRSIRGTVAAFGPGDAR